LSDLDNDQLHSTDFYFNVDYANLYCSDPADVYNYEYEKRKYFFRNLVIKSRLPEAIDLVGYDASTPYGYGGPCTNIEDEHMLRDVIVDYKRHLKQKGVIAEFIRFHPFLDSSMFANVLDYYEKEREIVYINLIGGKEERYKGYSSTTRNIIRKSYKNLEARISNNLNRFVELYTATMQKNKASAFYYFDRTYFEKLLNLEGCKLLEISYEGNIISMGLFFFQGRVAHYHLSANNYNYSKMNGNYMLLDYASEIATNEGCEYFMLGGGRTSAQDDSLLVFKSKFSPHRKDFYIGGIVSYNHKYNLASTKKVNPNSLDQGNSYFLNYRL